MGATLGAITDIITIHVTDATEGHLMMPRLSVRPNPNIVICTGQAITTRVIVAGAHPDKITKQRSQTGWAGQMHSAFQGMQNDNRRRN